MSPSSAFHWLLRVVMLHCGVVSPGELLWSSLPVRQSWCSVFCVLLEANVVVAFLKLLAFRVLLLWASGGESPSVGPVSSRAVGAVVYAAP
ncbi:hypothetical protein Taro_009964 [Colocasia esculenta]|uniref:Secreted protein n=1 Tax=Colocasia esculenta TaxID=4460 RepID=A0A843U6D4_COLES|nr:hypothetical protein [Colocasia esculenta]